LTFSVVPSFPPTGLKTPCIERGRERKREEERGQGTEKGRTLGGGRVGGWVCLDLDPTHPASLTPWLTFRAISSSIPAISAVVDIVSALILN